MPPIVSEEHLEARRRQILAASQRCFSRRGFDATTMQDICQEAELSPGAVYRYFEGKREIVEAVFELSVLENRKLADIPASFEDVGEGFDALFEMGFRIVELPDQRDDMRFGVLLHAEAVRDEGFAEQYARLYAALAEGFSGAVALAKDAGLIAAELDEEYVVRVLVALWEGFRVQKLIDPDLDTDRFLAAVKGLVFDRPANPS